MDAPLRFLLIDDNPDDRALVLRELRREFPGMVANEIIHAQNLAWALETRFDFVITDFQLRWTDGLSVLHAVKERHPDCPVIMFTGTGSEEVAVAAMKAGLDDYVLKSPRHYARLAGAVRATLERRESALQARRLRLELQTLLDRLNVGIFRATGEGILLQANPAFLKMLGMGELRPNTRLADFFCRPEEAASIQARLRAGEEFHEHPDRISRGGEELALALTQVMTSTEEGRTFIDGMAEDITGRQELEERLLQAQKLESVGQLAAGVAHDFNNILTIIQGYAMQLERERSLSAEGREAVHQVVTASERAATLTRQLLTFSRKQRIELSPVDFNDVLQQVSGMLRRLVDEGIELDFQFGSGIPRLLADRGMLEQVIMNLVVNARDAMPRGGRLTLLTRRVGDDTAPGFPGKEPDRVGNFVCFEVRDSGVGMSAAVQRRIFEPFFTTKDVGKGTGLGLATAYGIVQQHAGWIEVTSEVGRGSCFRVFLPEAPAEILESRVEASSPPGHGAGETILLVEDEPALRELEREVLEQGGYRVVPAESGVEALQLWQKIPAVDLLLTDMKMPDGISGPELADRLHEKSPGLKVLYTTGYSRELVSATTSFVDGRNFLQKPFAPSTLLRAVRGCLHG